MKQKNIVLVTIIVVLLVGGGIMFKNQIDQSVLNKNPVDIKMKEKGTSDFSNKSYGQAPEFIGVTKWLNPDNQPVSISQLKGKVILVDFWTLNCINCIHTLPHVTMWYDTYKDRGFIVIGVHTPEFAFEHEANNVKNAIKQYNIHYPVAQDNDFMTWRAFNNQYWPAYYLIDKKGFIRYEHFGEGEYDIAESTIQSLLKE